MLFITAIKRNTFFSWMLQYTKCSYAFIHFQQPVSQHHQMDYSYYCLACLKRSTMLNSLNALPLPLLFQACIRSTVAVTCHSKLIFTPPCFFYSKEQVSFGKIRFSKLVCPHEQILITHVLITVSCLPFFPVLLSGFTFPLVKTKWICQI